MNNKLTIILNDFNSIKKFNSEVIMFESDIDIVKGRYVVNAKSTIGIFTLDLSTPVEVVIYSNNKEEIKKFNDIMEEFRWEQ